MGAERNGMKYECGEELWGGMRSLVQRPLAEGERRYWPATRNTCSVSDKSRTDIIKPHKMRSPDRRDLKTLIV